MASTRTTFTLDADLAEAARSLEVNISAAARQGVADAVRRARGEADRQAYLLHPEEDGADWEAAEAWGDE